MVRLELEYTLYVHATCKDGGNSVLYYDKKCGNILLKPEVIDWCIDNLIGIPFYSNNSTHGDSMSLFFYMEFQNENDVMLFKLKWL